MLFLARSYIPHEKYGDYAVSASERDDETGDPDTFWITFSDLDEQARGVESSLFGPSS